MRTIPYDELRSALGMFLPYVVVAGICLAAGLSAIALASDLMRTISVCKQEDDLTIVVVEAR